MAASPAGKAAMAILARSAAPVESSMVVFHVAARSRLAARRLLVHVIVQPHD